MLEKEVGISRNVSQQFGARKRMIIWKGKVQTRITPYKNITLKADFRREDELI